MERTDIKKARSHKAVPDQIWNDRKAKFAWKKFKFGRGERPGPNSAHGKDIIKIEKCPFYANLAEGGRQQKTLFTKTLPCNCGYHVQKKPSTTVSASALAAADARKQKQSSSFTKAPTTGSDIATTNMQKIPTTSTATISTAGLDTAITTLPEAVPAVLIDKPNVGSSTSSVHAWQLKKEPVTPSGFQLPLEIDWSGSDDVMPLLPSPTQSPLFTPPISLPPPKVSMGRASSASGDDGCQPSKVPRLSDFLPNTDSTIASERDSLRPADYTRRLPPQWHENMEPFDCQWIGKMLFHPRTNRGTSVNETNLQLWSYPPSIGKTPKIADYFGKPIFIWAPRLLWRVSVKCPNCKAELTSKGLYPRVRLVLSLVSYYYLAGEYYECRTGTCSKTTLISYDQRLRDQLPIHFRCQFPVVLTWKSACDVSVISLLRSRTLGNSPTALCNSVLEMHSDEYMRKVLMYLQVTKKHNENLAALHQLPIRFPEHPKFNGIPQPKWFLSCYLRDVWSRIDVIKAAITSNYGSILKIDSTKKICKKLAGHAANTASWVTNVANERGEVLQSVVTTSESSVSLEKMATGLMKRYADAKEKPPVVLYTDRDCCSIYGNSKLLQLFAEWSDLEIRLDIWHFMRRIASCVNSESHPLYATFMGQLSDCIFEWDSSDFQKLQQAKAEVLRQNGIRRVTESMARESVTKQEMARHCKRKTRDADAIIKNIEQLLLTLSSATDALGEPLLTDDSSAIWLEQKKHVKCIQDVEGVNLYTVNGQITKGGFQLPVYRCARGSTSLESFHLHLNRFVPGSSANAVHFQAYLLDGIARWNAGRKADSLTGPTTQLRSFDVKLQHAANAIHTAMKNKPLLPAYQPPGNYTGESIGMEYLAEQSDFSLDPSRDLSREIDEGADTDDGFWDTLECPESAETDVTDANTLYSDFQQSDTDLFSDDNGEEEESATDRFGVAGYEKVDLLAQELLGLSGFSIPDNSAQRIKNLYDNLDQFDKAPLHFTPVKYSSSPKGRFGNKKKTGHVGLERMKRCFVSGRGPAHSPAKSRLVELLFIHLFQKHPQSSITVGARYVSQFEKVLSEYNALRGRVNNCSFLKKECTINLFNVNGSTIRKWYKDKSRREEINMLLTGKHLPVPHRTNVTAEVQPAKKKPETHAAPPHESMAFPEPEDTTGTANFRRKKDTTKVNIKQGSNVLTIELPKDIKLADFVGNVPQTLATPVEVQRVSKTTEWRKKKQAEAGIVKEPTKRKAYSCNFCGEALTSADTHTQFKGQRFCPKKFPNNSKEEWLAQHKAANDLKKSAAKRAQAASTTTCTILPATIKPPTSQQQ